MAIEKRTRKVSSRRPQSITATARRREASPILAACNLSREKKVFARQLQNNARRMSSVMAATNTSNIAARPDFLELLPIFVQKLVALDVFGSVAMNSRQQLIPYFKFIAENTKGETKAGTVLASPFVNRQGIDSNFTGRIVKNEVIKEADGVDEQMVANYVPILPYSATVSAKVGGEVKKYTDNGSGDLISAADGSVKGAINYSNGLIELTEAATEASITYQYDNETVGPDEAGKYGARMAKGYLQLDEINLVAEAHEIACYWSIYSAFAAQTEYGGNIGEIAKEAAFSELTAEINSYAFSKLEQAASLQPQFNWDAAPVMNGSVVPSDYLNMLKLKLNQAAASIYQRTNLSRPNRIVCGTNAAEYIGMINGFQADVAEDNVGPYHAGTLDHFEVFVDPNYDPDIWVMACKSQDIRRNSGLFGQYMPMVATDQIGLADASIQSGYCSMYSTKIINPASVAKGRLLGTF